MSWSSPPSVSKRKATETGSQQIPILVLKLLCFDNLPSFPCENVLAEMRVRRGPRSQILLSIKPFSPFVASVFLGHSMCTEIFCAQVVPIIKQNNRSVGENIRSKRLIMYHVLSPAIFWFILLWFLKWRLFWYDKVNQWNKGAKPKI